MQPLLSSLRRRLATRFVCQSCQRRYASSKAQLQKLPSSPARTRFAPSPTGYLHLGSLRTALFNYLLAKATGGQFLLRIEDTDQSRTVPGAEDRLCQDLEWAGLQWDEGPKIGGPYGPYKQSQRTALYREHAEQLLKSGSAYRCFCTPERLHALAKQRSELGLPTDYDRRCTHVSVDEADDRAAKGEAHVIRLKVPAVYPEFKDLVYGLVRNKSEKRPLAMMNPAYEDPILLKSDGFPTYHLANVVDDHHMKITHVVRGAEWMSSTPKHLTMYQAFGWQPPEFAHVGLLMDQNGQKLSKRNLDIDIASFKDKMGILPEVLTNFVALLGWSHNQKKDIMTLEQLIHNFSMKFTTGDTVVTFAKLWFLQKGHASQYIKRASGGDFSKLSLLTQPAIALLREQKADITASQILAGRSLEDYVKELFMLGGRGYTKTADFIDDHKYFFATPIEQDLRLSRTKFVLHNVPSEVSERQLHTSELSQSLKMLEMIADDQWNAETIRSFLDQIITTKAEEGFSHYLDVGGALDPEVTSKAIHKAWGVLLHNYIRHALLASMPGPSSTHTLVILGREESLRRLQLTEQLVERMEAEGTDVR